MIPRSTARRVLRDLSSHRPSRPLAPFFFFSPATLRPFASTPTFRLQARGPPPSPPPPMSPVPQNPHSVQQAVAANAALSNLSHLSPAQITALLSTSPPPSRRSVYLRRALWALFFFVVGYKITDDQLATVRFVYPFTNPPVEIDDPETIRMYRAEVTSAAIQDYPILQSMIPTINPATGLTAPTDWEHWEPYADFPPETLARHLCGGTLNDPNGLGLVHLVFRHRYTGELILAVVFGHSTSGWPSVVHGGMLSTIMDEAMGRLAALSFPANTAVTAKLAVDFKVPVTPGMLYIVRVAKALPEFQKARPDEEDKSDRKMWVVGRIEDPDGATVVEAKGLFVVPKGDAVKPLGKRF
ncbi:thioesterase [Colletotrichum graminicola M1.001]|uniref:Thioesterase n=1 Tax=Colletotrichum graminicola (strain M1.001 / M2 / FGSC 10212) TaxID=645133 RepID=E3Q718_COLGM|nr:thioesterase [Colletotrichum graminicola M1.001]EFQ26656.1 thioesterase [Colletotrichum graminicola M1.001]